jgi:uncharacterized membrane protein YgdD (TMEM256/DUF423 family)
MKLFLTVGAISGALAVILGAFGAHLLKQLISPEMLAVYKTGVEYQFYHTFALLTIGLLMHLKPSKILRLSGYFFIAGTLIFSGFLYLLAITGIKVLGAIVPIGGVLFITGWICLLIHILKVKN